MWQKKLFQSNPTSTCSYHLLMNYSSWCKAFGGIRDHRCPAEAFHSWSSKAKGAPDFFNLLVILNSTRRGIRKSASILIWKPFYSISYIILQASGHYASVCLRRMLIVFTQRQKKVRCEILCRKKNGINQNTMARFVLLVPLLLSSSFSPSAVTPDSCPVLARKCSKKIHHSRHTAPQLLWQASQPNICHPKQCENGGSGGGCCQGEWLERMRQRKDKSRAK